MDDRQFDALVKRLAQTRLSRLDALRGVAASALAGLAGVTLSEAESEAKRHRKRRRKGKGNGKGNGPSKQGKGKAQWQQGHAAQECSPNRGAKQPDGCPCKGNGNCQSKSCCPTAGGSSGICCPAGRCINGICATTTTAAPTTTSTTTTEAPTPPSTTTSTTSTTSTTTTTTAAPVECSPGRPATNCERSVRVDCPGTECNQVQNVDGGCSCDGGVCTNEPCTTGSDCDSAPGAGDGACIRVPGCCAIDTFCGTQCGPTTVARAARRRYVK